MRHMSIIMCILPPRNALTKVDTDVNLYPSVSWSRGLSACGLSELMTCVLRWHVQMAGSFACWRLLLCRLGVFWSLARWAVGMQPGRFVLFSSFLRVR